MQASREPILALAAVIPELNKIEASIPYDFEAKNLTAYGDVLPVAALLEKPGLPQVVEETITAVRAARADADQAAHVELRTVTLDTDTTVHTLFSQQMEGPKSYNPKNGGKKSYRPILTFLAETREYIRGELRNGDHPSGVRIARRLESVFAALPGSG